MVSINIVIKCLTSVLFLKYFSIYGSLNTFLLNGEKMQQDKSNTTNFLHFLFSMFKVLPLTYVFVIYDLGQYKHMQESIYISLIYVLVDVSLVSFRCQHK